MTNDDALIERIAEAIYAAHGSPSGMMPTYLADARAVYDVAYPAIHDKTIDEVALELEALGSEYHSTFAAGIRAAEDAVCSLRTDSKGDGE